MPRITYDGQSCFCTYVVVVQSRISWTRRDALRRFGSRDGHVSFTRFGSISIREGLGRSLKKEMDDDDWNSPTTKLLTLLNVSAAKSLKRKCTDQQPHKPDKRRVLDHISPNSALSEVNADGAVSAIDSIGEQKDDSDANVNEAAELSDAEGECQYPWFKQTLGADWTMRKSRRTNGTSDQRRRF